MANKKTPPTYEEVTVSENLPEIVKNYPLLKSDEAMELIKLNCGGSIDPLRDMPRAKTTSSCQWEIDTGGEEPELVKTIKGVCVFYTDQRSYWVKSFEESQGDPPDCRSTDCTIGIPSRPEEWTPIPNVDTYHCARCAFSQFGSKGHGQACSQNRFLFVMRENHAFPTLIKLPPTSAAPCKKFMTSLIYDGVPFYSTVMEIGLVPEKSRDNIKYAKATFKSAEHVDPSLREKMKGIYTAFKELFGETDFSTVTRDEHEGANA